MSASEVQSEFRVQSRDGVREVWLPMGSGEPEPWLLASLGLDLLAHARQLDEHLLHGWSCKSSGSRGARKDLSPAADLGH